MLVALRCRILERRNKDMVSLMRFLQNFSISSVDNYDEFCYSNKSAVVSKGMEHLYGLLSSATTNTSATNLPAELCFIASENMTLSNELQNAIAAVSVVQASTSKTAKVFFKYCIFSYFFKKLIKF
jgi:hypothetical protein